MDITLIIKKNKKGYYYDTEDGIKYLTPNQVKKIKNKIKNKDKMPTMSNNQAVYIFQSNPKPTKRLKRSLNKGNKRISKDDKKRIDDVEQYYRNRDLNISLNKPSTRYQITGTQFDPLKYENKLKIEGLENKIKLLEINPRVSVNDKRALDYYRSIIRSLQYKTTRTQPTIEEVEEVEEEIYKIEPPKIEQPKKGWMSWLTGSKEPEEEFEKYDKPLYDKPLKEEEEPPKEKEKAGSRSHELHKSEGKIKCPVCGKSYKSQGFRAHFDLKHKNNEEYDEWIRAYKLLQKLKK